MTLEILLLLILLIGVLATVLLAALALLRLSALRSGTQEQIVRDELRMGREELARDSRSLREEIARTQRDSGELLINALARLGDGQKTKLDEIALAARQLTESNRQEITTLREKLEVQFRHIQENNERKLDQMRQTVDEKLHNTLEKRLGESFKLVSERLEAVQRGLGEMQNLANGVGDLKRVLTNVKTRGTWGEIQLGAILEQILTPDQYEHNVHVRKESAEVVEFAIKLPGKSDQADQPVWLPIDSKFPKDDYERLLDATQSGNPEAVQQSTDALIRGIHKCSKDIGEKYIHPPHTTDFAILFLPTEGLYAEVLRQPGLHDQLQLKYKVLPAGPTTLSAILNSLRMGFRTLAIEQRSSEVWQILAAVKSEFAKFGDVLDKVKKQLATASNTIEETSIRSRAMERKLKTVEHLTPDASRAILQLPDAADEQDISAS
ncbi:MAG: DNA recombination protein RmuC [Lentisphaerota bacterium]